MENPSYKEIPLLLKAVIAKSRKQSSYAIQALWAIQLFSPLVHSIYLSIGINVRFAAMMADVGDGLL